MSFLITGNGGLQQILNIDKLREQLPLLQGFIDEKKGVSDSIIALATQNDDRGSQFITISQNVYNDFSNTVSSVRDFNTGAVSNNASVNRVYYKDTLTGFNELTTSSLNTFLTVQDASYVFVLPSVLSPNNELSIDIDMEVNGYNIFGFIQLRILVEVGGQSYSSFTNKISETGDFITACHISFTTDFMKNHPSQIPTIKIQHWRNVSGGLLHIKNIVWNVFEISTTQ